MNKFVDRLLSDDISLKSIEDLEFRQLSNLDKSWLKLQLYVESKSEMEFITLTEQLIVDTEIWIQIKENEFALINLMILILTISKNHMDKLNPETRIILEQKLFNNFNAQIDILIERSSIFSLISNYSIEVQIITLFNLLELYYPIRDYQNQDKMNLILEMISQIHSLSGINPISNRRKIKLYLIKFDIYEIQGDFDQSILQTQEILSLLSSTTVNELLVRDSYEYLDIIEVIFRTDTLTRNRESSKIDLQSSVEQLNNNNANHNIIKNIIEAEIFSNQYFEIEDIKIVEQIIHTIITKFESNQMLINRLNIDGLDKTSLEIENFNYFSSNLIKLSKLDDYPIFSSKFNIIKAKIEKNLIDLETNEFISNENISLRSTYIFYYNYYWYKLLYEFDLTLSSELDKILSFFVSKFNDKIYLTRLFYLNIKCKFTSNQLLETLQLIEEYDQIGISQEKRVKILPRVHFDIVIIEQFIRIILNMKKSKSIFDPHISVREEKTKSLQTYSLNLIRAFELYRNLNPLNVAELSSVLTTIHTTFKQLKIPNTSTIILNYVICLYSEFRLWQIFKNGDFLDIIERYQTPFLFNNTISITMKFLMEANYYLETRKYSQAQKIIEILMTTIKEEYLMKIPAIRDTLHDIKEQIDNMMLESKKIENTIDLNQDIAQFVEKLILHSK